LYETGAEFITYVPYEKSFTSLANKFAYAIEHAAGTLDHPAIRQHLDMQSLPHSIYLLLDQTMYQRNSINYQCLLFHHLI